MDNKKAISKYLYLAIIWGLITSAVTLIPSNEIPYSKFISIYDLDNIIHAIIFLIFCFFLFLGFQESNLKININPYLLAFAISVIYGFLLELIQITIPKRGFEYLDVISNTVGSFFGLGFGYLFKRIKNG